MSNQQSNQLPPEPSAAGVYRPLAATESFRLLSILPGAGSDPLECNLQYASLDDPPEYETMSYCWGDASVKESAVLDGRAVSITASSEAALRRVRLSDRARVVWIDAVCINQGDSDERSSQVLRMSAIYPMGKQNLIYLGEADMREAFDSVRDICAQMEAEDFQQLIKSNNGEMATSRSESIQICNEKALSELFSNDWFSRVWTWQEAIISPHSVCLCGLLELTLLEIARAAHGLTYNIHFLDNPDLVDKCINIGMTGSFIDPVIMEDDERNEEVFELSDHVMVLHGRKCSLAVDRIFSLLGVCPQLKITPDYRKPLKEVFQAGFRAMITYDRSLDLLSGATRLSLPTYSHLLGLSSDCRPWYFELMLPEDEAVELPSWIPPWYRPSCILDTLVSALALESDACRGRKFEPQSTLPGITEQSEKSGVLRCFGVKAGKVIRKVSRQLDDTSDINLHVPSLIHDVEALAVHCLSLRRMSEGFPMAGRTYFEPPEVEIATVLSLGMIEDTDKFDPVHSYRAYRKIVKAGRADDVPIPSEIDDETFTNLARSSETIDETDWELAANFPRCFLGGGFWLRAIFGTDTGHLGAGPITMEEGDIVAILNGLDSPAILRPSGKYFLFIGTALVCGIMNGEAIEEHEKNGGTDQLFELC